MVSVAMIRPDRPDGFSHRKVTEEYVRMKGIPWTVLDDSSGYANDLYKVISTPTTFLIAPDGQIVFRKTGSMDMNRLRNDILAMFRSSQTLPPVSTGGHS